MRKNLFDIPGCCFRRRQGRGSWQDKKIHPLSQACCQGRLKVCKITGDRRLCARMASLGLLPGSEVELLCPVQGRQCMLKVNGGTISLDGIAAENILVTSAQ